MVREYLLSGKLYKAITFGMDVPSLLFSDQEGKVPVNIPFTICKKLQLYNKKLPLPN